MKKLAKFMAVLMVLILAMPILAACGPKEPEVDPMPNTLKIAATSVPKQLNPYSGSNTETFVTSSVYEGLYYWDDETNWYANDGLGVALTSPSTGAAITATTDISSDSKVRITLDSKAKWSDGTDVTVEDIMFTFDYLAKIASVDGNLVFPIQGTFVTDALNIDCSYRPVQGGGFSNYTHSTVFTDISEDKKSMTMTLAHPTTDVLRPLFTSILIIPKHIWETVTNPKHANTGTNSPKPVGCGPYIVTSFSDQLVKLDRNPHYHSPDAYAPESMLLLLEGQIEKAILQLQNGTVDVLYNDVSSDNASVYEDGTKGIELYTADSPSVTTMMVNTRTHYGADPRFREAIALSVNQETFVDSVLKGFGTEAGPSLSVDTRVTGTGDDVSDNPFFKKADGTAYKSNEATPPNVTKARQLLDIYFAEEETKTALGKTYVYNASTGYYQSGNDRFTLKLFTKVGGETLTKSQMINSLKSIGIHMTLDDLGGSHASEATLLRDGGVDAAFDIYVWNVLVEISNYYVTFAYHFESTDKKRTNTDSLIGYGSEYQIPSSSFNYGYFDSRTYTAANLEKWYGAGNYPGVTDDSMVKLYEKVYTLNENIVNLNKVTGTAKTALSKEIQSQICGTYYKIPVYTSQYLNLYNTKRWTGWTEKNFYSILNADTFKNLTYVGNAGE